MDTVRVAQFGLGPIGIACLCLLAEKRWAKIVGGVDIDPQKTGTSLATLTGMAKLKGARVYSTFEELWTESLPEVVLHTTGSSASTSIEQIRPMVSRGVSVVSSCEELLYPQLRAPEALAQLHKTCLESGSRVLATG